MIRTIAEQQGLKHFYTYNKIEIVEIDGKRYVRKKSGKKAPRNSGYLRGYSA